MGVSLFDQDDAADHVNAKLASRQWWIFVGASSVLTNVEESFYIGAASADFEVLLGPPVGPFRELFPQALILPLTFAHKRQMTAAQLARLVREGGGDVTAEQLEQQDVFFIEDVA